MSDPVSNHDIEDVLSSIRRLVAQGDPRRMEPKGATKPVSVPKPVEEPVKEEASTPPPPTERLVLTPAFRVLTPEVDEPEVIEAASAAVVEEYDTAADMTESVASETAKPELDRLSERASLEAKIAALEAAVSDVSDDFEPDGSEISPKPTLETTFLGTRDNAGVAEPDDSEDTEATLNSAVVDHIAATVADEIAGAFPHLNAAEAAVEEDQTVVPLKRDIPLASAAVEPATETGRADNADKPSGEEAEIVTVAPKIHKPAAFRRAPVAPPDDAKPAEPAPVEPEIEVVEPISPEAPTFRHSVREVYDPVAEATADAAEDVSDGTDIYGDELAPDTPTPGTAVAEKAAPGALMDPDMVRDLVGQMIREELQGEMGERITRNVRKLVRREINRVLSAQEFD